jgi:hypothetical protein
VVKWRSNIERECKPSGTFKKISKQGKKFVAKNNKCESWSIPWVLDKVPDVDVS